MNTALATRNAGAPPATQHRARHILRAQRPRTRQRGISMFIVMIILLLALILVIGGLTVTNLNESVVGNQSDAQRAYGAAQALMDAAQLDIRLNGRNCNAALVGGQGFNSTFTVVTASATGPAACWQRFPRDMDEYMEMVHSGQILKRSCAASTGTSANLVGVCIPMGPTDDRFDGRHIGDPDKSAQQWGHTAATDNGATYGNAFIKALDGTGATTYGGGAQLGASTAALDNGRYWVEVFPYNTYSVGLPEGMGRAPAPAHEYPFVFRITAMARGLKGGTVSVLRSYYTPFPMPAAPVNASSPS